MVTQQILPARNVFVDFEVASTISVATIAMLSAARTNGKRLQSRITAYIWAMLSVAANKVINGDLPEDAIYIGGSPTDSVSPD